MKLNKTFNLKSNFWRIVWALQHWSIIYKWCVPCISIFLYFVSPGCRCRRRAFITQSPLADSSATLTTALCPPSHKIPALLRRFHQKSHVFHVLFCPFCVFQHLTFLHLWGKAGLPLYKWKGCLIFHFSSAWIFFNSNLFSYFNFALTEKKYL